LGVTLQQWEDFYFTEEDYQNYGYCTTLLLYIVIIDSVYNVYALFA